MKTALVAGAGGFIGGHLVDQLKADGYWVRGVDGKEPEFGSTSADEFAVLDLRDRSECLAALDGVGTFDEVYQFGRRHGGHGFIHVAECEIMRNNALINLNMVDATAAAGGAVPQGGRGRRRRHHRRMGGRHRGAVVHRRRRPRRRRAGLMASDLDTPTNIGTREYVSVKKLVEMVTEVAGKNVGINWVDGPVGVQSRNFSNDAIASIGWAPKHSLHDGIARTYPWIAGQVARQTLTPGGAR